MHTDPTPPTPLVADTTGSSATFEKLPSYDIEPEDREIADAIIGFDHHEVPSPIEAEGEFRVPERFTARMLPDALRHEVQQELTRIPNGEARDRKEHELVLERLRKNSMDVRVRLGLGSGANPYQREVFALQRDVEKVQQDAAGVLNALNEVVRLDVVGVNPVTGEQLTKTVYRAEGETRRALELRHAELMRHIAALEGIEGDRRLKRALFEAVEGEKSARAQVSRRAKAKALAEEMLEEEAVRRQAEAYARNRRHSFG